MRIFIVEDEAVIAMDLRERLAVLGYDVCGNATHGEMAAQVIAEQQPDIVLMDVKLAGPMDGVDVAQQLRERCDVPVVFLTAYSDEPLVERATHTNAYGFLVKPFDERELHAVLQVALARHRADRDLRQKVVVDALTGLHNRRFLDEMLPIEIGRARRDRQTLSLAMIDIDEFKRVNDTHGHEAGDYVLQQIAKILRSAVRASDLACRYGGEEFTVVMPGIDAAGAAQKMRAICALLRVYDMVFHGVKLSPTLSVGVAEMPVTGVGPADLLRAADEALYRAKNEGRDRVCEAPADDVAGDRTNA